MIQSGSLYATARAVAVSGRYTFTTFEEYVEERWDMARDVAYRLIQHADAADKLSEKSDVLLARESHVRELLKVESDDDRASVWMTVVGRGETITAKVVSEEVERKVLNVTHG